MSSTRFLMLWFFVALQAMTPFIHAHAGAAPLSHADFPHVHQGVHGDVHYDAIVHGEQGEEIAVAQGIPSRYDVVAGAEPDALWMAPGALSVAAARGPGASLSWPPPPHFSPPEHTLPHALAPPLR